MTDEAKWFNEFCSVSGLMRVVMTHALTRLDCIGNTANYLSSVSTKTEKERSEAEMWRRMYVECGSNHDPITRLLMCEGSSTSDLGSIMLEIDNLVRFRCIARHVLTDADGGAAHALLQVDEGGSRYDDLSVYYQHSKARVQSTMSKLSRLRQNI